MSFITVNRYIVQSFKGNEFQSLIEKKEKKVFLPVAPKINCTTIQFQVRWLCAIKWKNKNKYAKRKKKMSWYIHIQCLCTSIDRHQKNKRNKTLKEHAANVIAWKRIPFLILIDVCIRANCHLICLVFYILYIM